MRQLLDRKIGDFALWEFILFLLLAGTLLGGEGFIDLLFGGSGHG